jgi:hypothetical protein
MKDMLDKIKIINTVQYILEFGVTKVDNWYHKDVIEQYIV